MKVALQTVSRSGNVYRLHAFFTVQDAKTGDFVTAFSSDLDDVFSPQVSTVLRTGDYILRLEPGWALELVSVGGGSAGAPGIAGAPPMSSAGRGPIGKASFGESIGELPLPVPPLADVTPPFPGLEGGAGGAAGAPEIGGSPSAGGTLPVGGSFPFPTAGKQGFPAGSPNTGGSAPFPVPGGIVPAQLVNNAVQFFSLFGGDEAFINYQFHVGDEIVDFSRGRLRIGFTVDDSDLCIPPSSGIDQNRVMLEHSVDALAGIGVLDVFSAMVANEARDTDPLLLYRQLIDSYATADQGRLGPEAAHCGDEQTNGAPSLNGFPIDCNRRERFQFDNVGFWFATAFVNRMDLAPQNGAHCGQQRMIFANNAQGRMFIIFEAQIPNPNPELGLQGCRPLAEFWMAQNDIPDAKLRGERLRKAFFSGDPELLSRGFGPFVKASNYTIGSGQVRTNQFDDAPWTLREFKLALDGAALKVLPFPVSESPNGGLWDEGLDLPAGPVCRESFIQAAEGLLTNHPAEMSFVVDQACKNAESRNDFFSEAYDVRMSNGYRNLLDAIFQPFGLTSKDIANRARFAGSCIGCHVEANGVSLGGGAAAPFSLDFVHVGEFAVPCADGACFPISSGLQSVFLPRRLRAVTDLLGLEPPPNPCTGSGGGTGTGGGDPGFPAGRGGAGGAFPMDGAAAGDAAEEPLPPPVLPVPAPEIDITLPQASVPVEELQAADAEIREAYGDRTLGGKDARVTH